MYPNIVKFLSLIRKDINIVVTTNGSLLTPDLAKAMTPYVKGMNISIHHSTSAKHEELTKIKLNGDILHKSIQAFGKDKIRINCNLVKGYVNTLKEVEAMYKFVERLGVKKIRFAELQNCPALYVDARTIFANIPADPFKDGCEITLHHKDLEVLLRVTCGIVNTDKDPIENPVGRNPQTQIMYSNGQVQDSWLDRNGSPVNDLDCHSARSYRGGCC
jgi:Molybdenum cofactor biosynthesis enzyme